MANWKEYTTKTTPEDADEIMIADSKANASKRTPFSGLWNWIANKLATAVISQLETQNKSIIPALNELNSNGKYEGIFTLKPSIAMTFPIKMRHSYVLLFKYIDQDTIKSIRACIMCSKQREDAEGMTLWLTQETESIAILIETESCSVTSKNSWIALSVHEL